MTAFNERDSVWKRKEFVMRIQTQRAKAVLNMQTAVDLISEGNDAIALRHIKHAYNAINKIVEPAKEPDIKK